MKLGSMRFPFLFVSALSGLSSAASFENTAPLLINWNALASNDVSFREIDTIQKTSEKIKQITDSICLKSPEQSITYVRFHGLDESDITKEFVEHYSLSIVSDHVVYRSAEDTTGYNIGEECSDVSIVDVESINSWAEVMQDASSNVMIFEIYKDSAKDDLKEILQLSGHSNVIVQGLPAFDDPSHTLFNQATLNLLNRKKNNNNSKREDIDYEEVERELQESFEKVNELLEDQLAEIYEKSESNVYSSGAQTNTKKHIMVDGSLFDKYGFFSTGIWMGTIVLLFLAWLLSIALGWLNSMQISYGAFEKPFDFEKKLQ
ncbi:hypothetical protein PMKS-003128 [Pichia membranifaciens]|uniref:Protein BIG1 n=1 Tax=Pichia membranifaciens TaxID=4926 RepID=A0A1Q2YJ97_9ASCO|nr:hypothetical protein PMKS-003128 [Pichia membranifaciens]